MRNSRIDIRSVQFKDAILTNENFQNVRSGQKLVKKIKIALFSIILGCFSVLISSLSSGILNAIYEDKVTKISLFTEIALTLIYSIFLALIVVRGWEIGASILVVTLIVVGLLAYVVFETKNPGIGVAALLLGLSITLAWIGAAITAFFVALMSLCYGIIGEFLTSLGYGLTAGVITLVDLNINGKSKPGEGTLLIIVEFGVILGGAIIARRAVKEVPEFAWLRKIAVFWAATGGTSFYGADLTDACFDGADLRHTDFRKANLTRTSFKDATGLELARLQGTILEQPKVRKLLTTHHGQGEDLTEADLCGANLRGADLTGAILVKAQVLNADFSAAFLTDACIQNWNINHNTRFQDVDCQRVYLKRNKHGHFLEPKPDSGEFQPGEFEKWITDVRDTIDLIFQNGLNWRAFAFSLTQTAINNDGLGLSVRSIENKGDGVVVAKVGVSVETNKTAIHQEITSHYNDAVKAIEAKYQLVLKAKDGEIQRLTTFYESQQQFIQGLVTGIAETKGKVMIQGEGNRVYMMNQAGDIMESNNQNIRAGANVDMSSGAKVTVGRDVTGSSITLGDLNGQVTNTIQQLKDISTDSSDKLAEILTLLQKSITDDAALSEGKKQEALEAVETIAEEGKKPPEERAIKLCSMAVNALRGITGTVTDVSKLAEIFNTQLPTLTGLLGI